MGLKDLITKKTPAKKTDASKKAPAKKVNVKERDVAGKKNHEQKQNSLKMKSFVHARAMPKGAKLVEVKALVNMSCLDGTMLVAGKTCEVSDVELKRLEKDARHIKSPFFEKP